MSAVTVTVTIEQIRREAFFALKGVSPSARLDADVIIAAVLRKSREYVLFHREQIVSKPDAEAIKAAIKERASGVPVAYITGTKEFFGRDFAVNKDVLIPKPDTELLVEVSLERLLERSYKSIGALKVCDMCCGSGCVGISIALEAAPFFPVELTLSDVSLPALSVAKKNAASLIEKRAPSLSNPISVSFAQSDLFKDFSPSASFDLIASNPPYVPHEMALSLLEDGRSEPLLALDGDGDEDGSSDGLSLTRRLIQQASSRLKARGVLAVESGEYNIFQAADVFSDCAFQDVRVFNDLSNLPRVICGTKHF